jgi:hypothetical protein
MLPHPEIEAERLRHAGADSTEISIGGVEQDVLLLGHDGGGNNQDGAFLVGSRPYRQQTSDRRATGSPTLTSIIDRHTLPRF